MNKELYAYVSVDDVPIVKACREFNEALRNLSIVFCRETGLNWLTVTLNDWLTIDEGGDDAND